MGVFSSVIVGGNGLPVVAYTHLSTAPAGVSELRLLVCKNLGCTDTAISTIVASGQGHGWYPSMRLMGDSVHVAISYATVNGPSSSTVSMLICDPTAVGGNCRQPLGGGANVLTSQFHSPGWTSLSLVEGIPAVAFAATNASHSTIGYALCVDSMCTSVGATQFVYTVGTANLFNWGSDRMMEHPYFAFYQDGAGLVLLHCLDKACSPSIVLSQVLDPWGYNNDVGLYASITLSASTRLPSIVYHDASNLQLKLILCRDEACNERTARRYPSTYGWDPKLAIDPVSGFPLIAYGDPGDNRTSLLVCGDPTCDPAFAATTVVALGTAERIGIVATPFYRPAVVMHRLADFSMHISLLASDSACLVEQTYPCSPHVGVTFTNPATPYFVTNATGINVTGIITGITNTNGLTLTGGSFTLHPNGTFSGNVVLVPGVNVIIVNVVNGTAGIIGTATVQIVSDTVAPVITITSPANGTTICKWMCSLRILSF